MDKKLLKAFAKRIEYWANSGKDCHDKHLAIAYESDVKDLRKVYGLIESGDYQKAYGVAKSLDTIVREQIPDGVWELLQRRGS